MNVQVGGRHGLRGIAIAIGLVGRREDSVLVGAHGDGWFGRARGSVWRRGMEEECLGIQLDGLFFFCMDGLGGLRAGRDTDCAAPSTVQHGQTHWHRRPWRGVITAC